MPGNPHPTGRQQRPPRTPPKPLDAARLEELALAYVARFATTGTKLERYLARKLRERGWESETGPDLAGLALRYQELGYVDDASFARARSGDLLRRGYGVRRIDQALGEAGVAEEVRADVRPGGAAQWRAALALAQKRRFGPFGSEKPDRPKRQKQIAAMLRAGHQLDCVLRLIDAESEAAAEQWAIEAQEDEE